MATWDSTKYQSLASVIKAEVNFKEEFMKFNANARDIRNYVIHERKIIPELSCSVGKCAKQKQAVPVKINVNGSSTDGLAHFILCISCDRIYHLQCAVIGQVTNDDLIWMCQECRTSPDNSYAKEFYATGNFNLSFERRIELITETEEDESDEEDKYDFIDKTLHVDRSLNPLDMSKYWYEQCIKQQQQTVAAFDLFKAKEQEVKEKVHEMADLQEKLSEASKSIAQHREDRAKSQKSIRFDTSPQRSNVLTVGELLREREAELTAQTSNSLFNDSMPFCAQSARANHNSRRTHSSQARNSTLNNSESFVRDHLARFDLNDVRKNLPKIENFDGNPMKWITFQRAVERNRREGQYSDEITKYHIRNALTGAALQRVESLFDFATADEIIGFLKESYGNSMVVVDSAKNKVLGVKLPKQLTHAAVMDVTTTIATYISACRYAKLQSHDLQLSRHIHSQLEPMHQQGYYQYFLAKFPNEMRVERLDVQFDYLNQLANTLPIGSFKSGEDKPSIKPYQVMTVSAFDNGPKSKFSKPNKEDFKFQIRDKMQAPYCGYDMSQVKELAKSCKICGKTSHFTLECHSYREMPMDEKYNMVKSKNLCMNCLLTTDHVASQCKVKVGCGFSIDINVKCTGRHHISLHRGRSLIAEKFANNSKPKRRSQTKSNQQKASNLFENLNDKSESSQVNAHQLVHSDTMINNTDEESQESDTETQTSKYEGYSTHLIATMGLKLNAQGVNSSPRTIKLFRALIHGASNTALAFAVGDSAAEITLIKKSLADELGLTGEDCTLQLQWTNNSIIATKASKLSFTIQGICPGSQKYRLKECYAVDNLNLPPRSLNVDELKKEYPHLRDIPFASYNQAEPVMLIGSRHAYLIEAIESVKQGGEGKPVGIKSRLGFTIYGGAPDERFVKTYTSCPIVAADEECKSLEPAVSNEELKHAYEISCSIESLGIKAPATYVTKDEKNALIVAESGIRKLANGSIEMPLIWAMDNDKLPTLPNNYPMVMKRQIAHERKLAKDSALMEAFNHNFKQLIDDGYIRAATEKDMKSNWPNESYVPMTLVVNSNKVPVKTRIVYDASAKYKGVALNDKLLSGPNLLINILKPLMQFRANKIAFVADVQKMFHRILINERDQQCQRLLWRENTDKPMSVYIMTCMMFGPKCSPFVSQFVKNKVAEKFENTYPDAAKALKEFTYMDDVLYSEASLDKAIETAQNCIKILEDVNWNLVGFQSNNLKFLEALPNTHVKGEIIPILSSSEENYATKVLGIAWNPRTDCFIFQLDSNIFIKLVEECNFRPTKRMQCSTIARIFDVLGLITHVVIRGKILLQRSWRNKIDWDDQISDEDYRIWKKWLMDLKKISKLEIPRQRFHNLNSLQSAHSLELHTFADAGKEAMATVSYLVASVNQFRQTSFVMSKAKVTPIKIKTKMEISEIPRLELTACLLAARLSSTITKLHSELRIEKFLWTDSKIVLAWLKNENLRLPKFAISPVQEVLELTDRANWNYVDSKNNPADIATKFQKFDFEDINSVWFTGPRYLKMPQKHWPQQSDIDPEPALVLSLLKPQIIDERHLIKAQLPHIDCPIASQYIVDLLPASITDNWSKLLRAIARALKFYFEALIPWIKSKQWFSKVSWPQIKGSYDSEKLEPKDIERAQLFIIRRMQQECYAIEFKQLKLGKQVRNKEFLQLQAFVDIDNIIRIDSRVALPFNEYSQKYAPLVPHNSSLTRALLMHFHQKFGHVCIEYQSAEFRAFAWMGPLRTELNKIKTSCNYCHLKGARPIPPKMAALPIERISPTLKPFQITGLDVAGPYEIFANNGHAKKTWILLFTCTMSRFIHLNILDSMGSGHVLEAIISINACHGPIAELISDNGTNFVGAARIIQQDKLRIINELKKINNEVQAEIAQKYLLAWKFIPPQSPWWGGFYERLIKEVKRAIAAAIEGKKVNRLQFNIALQEAALRINCRPLTHIPVSHEEAEILTPHHLAKYRSGWPLLPSITSETKPHNPLNDKSNYKKGRQLADEIMRRFVSYYLPELTRRTKWYKDVKPIKVNDLVLLVDPNKTRQAWERARVVKIYPSKDGRGRVADVVLSDGTLRSRRSVQRLAKIEISTA